MEANGQKVGIPDFIHKIYGILQKNEFQDILCWGVNNQVHIKNPRKLQKLVLPLYFRHNRIESFVRQLNIYRFNKVSRKAKEKNHLYFFNQHFQKGNKQSLSKIQRKTKIRQNLSNRESQNISQSSQSDNGNVYREFVRENVVAIQRELSSIQTEYPTILPRLSRIIQISKLLAGKDPDEILFSPAEDESLKQKGSHSFSRFENLHSTWLINAEEQFTSIDQYFVKG